MILERYIEPEKDDEAIVTLPTTFDEKAWQELLELLRDLSFESPELAQDLKAIHGLDVEIEWIGITWHEMS
jgi:hypothetical protein